MNARELYESQRTLIDDVIRFICGRHHLRSDEAEDYGSSVHIKLLVDDCAILRKFQGKCSLRTYLVTVLYRLLLDHRTQKWGKWRPSSRASALGPVAVELEKLIHRDGHSLSEAVEILKSDKQVSSSPGELEEIAEQLPHRLRRRMEGGEAVEHLTSEVGSAEKMVLDREQEAARVKTETALGSVMPGLTYEDRLILKMRFEDGFEVVQIAQALHLEAKPLYKRIEKSLRQIRKALEGQGLGREEIVGLLESTGWEIDVHYEIRQGKPESGSSNLSEDRSAGPAG